MPTAVAARVAAYERLHGGAPYALLPAGERPPVVFPAGAIVTRAWIALTPSPSLPWHQWGWADVTEFVRKDLGITVDAGRRNESTRVNPSRCQLKFDNRDGRFVRLNPTGPYYPYLTRNTPIWLQLDPGDGFVDRFHGYVNEWPTRWTDPSGNNSYVTVQCAGVLRRLGQGEAITTPLDTTILAASPVGYWRMDDPAGSTRFESSLAGGGLPLLQFGTESVEFATLDSPPGGTGRAAAQFPDNAVVAAGPAPATTLTVAAPWTIEWSAYRPDDGSADAAAFEVAFEVGVTPNSVAVAVAEDTAVSARDWYHYLFQGTQNGADWEVRWWRNGIAKGLAATGVGTLGRLIDFVIDPGASGLGVGYVAAYDHTDVDAETHSEALQAFAGEMAHVRMARICAEAGVAFRCQATTSAACGPQPNDTVLAILRDAEKTDQGVLYEREFGLAYQALSERYNQPAGLVLDFDQRHISGTPEAIDDDQRLRNQWTIRNTNTGTSRTARNDSSITAEGLYDDGDSVNLSDDSQVYAHASHRVWVGIVDEIRWPRVAINLGRTPDLIPHWLATRLNDRVLIANPPQGMPPDDIDVVLEGYVERWDQRSWTASLNLSPSRPYQVGNAGDTTTSGSWVQTVDAVLAEDLDTTETTIDVTSSEDWTNADPAGEPLVIGGEVMALDAVSGAAPNWTFTVRRSVNNVSKTHLAGTSVRVHRPLVVAL